MKWMMTFWVTVTAWLSYEFYVIESHPKLSLFNYLGRLIFRSNENLTMEPGRTISYYLGWIGLGLMIIMNIYMLRKRMMFMRKWGKLKNWLNFHIFCGLLGTTLIIFHSGFKVRGLVGISFWSMIISATSGIIGKYFFSQISKTKNQLLSEANTIHEKLKIEMTMQKKIATEELIEKYEKKLLSFVGGNLNSHSPIEVIFGSLSGDLRIAFGRIPRLSGVSRIVTRKWVRYSLLVRRANLVESFEELMGYWHLFHTPFAIFMYISAFIHVVSAMIFLVK